MPRRPVPPTTGLGPVLPTASRRPNSSKSTDNLHKPVTESGNKSLDEKKKIKTQTQAPSPSARHDEARLSTLNTDEQAD